MRIQCTVTGPKGTPDASYVAAVDDGGTRVEGPGEDPAADLVLTLSRRDLDDVVAGADPAALFMQGRLKVVGSMGRLLSLMPLRSQPLFTDVHRALS